MEERIRLSNIRTASHISYPAHIVIAIVVMTGVFYFSQQGALNAVLHYLLPLPVVYMALRYSLREGIITLSATTLLITVLSGYQSGMLFLFTSGIIAVIFSLCFLRRYSATTTISWATLYYLAIGVASVYMREGGTYAAYIQELTVVFKAQFANLFQHSGIEQQGFTQQLEALAHVQSLTFPFLSALTTSVIMFGVTRVGLRMGKIALIPLLPFHQWRVSDHFVWLFVLGGLLHLLEATRIIGLNILLGIILLYYLAGCAVIAYFLKRREARRIIQIITYILLFMQLPYIFISLGLLFIGASGGSLYLPLPAIILVAGIGLTNIWIDFRKHLEGAGEETK